MLNASHNFTEALRQAQSEKSIVELFLKSGISFKGKVASVSETSIIIDPLSGKDFFAAQVLISEINAISMQVRT